ncbi:DUF5672 family protein [Mucilaginibacter agri]|uniref:DUF5672 domain-containing protein n=1 Tax=Mucilaginibacter agri TaxID=2695265 RepID=A0A965ZG01_9SPHI|nr:DUF5672 family protein [Mucilaginibacter agri]NCD70353.1 hypothetical protein [Mucilaginibacter agri]
MLQKVAIVIPFYRDAISPYEKIALQQCENVLAAYPKIAIKPNSLKIPVDANMVSIEEEVSFDDSFFKGIEGYNKLMLSPIFYEQFLAYEYILIYQMDAFVFKDELADWCSQNWDYIGAPWIRKQIVSNPFKAAVLKAQQYLSTEFNLKKRGVPNKYQFENRVGNGGFSLRRVRPFYEVCVSMDKQIKEYLAYTAHQYNEDAFWSIEVNRKKKMLNIPDWQTGLKFAFEYAPQTAYGLNGYQLPFGCHDWDNYLEFWGPIFGKLGYEI